MEKIKIKEEIYDCSDEIPMEMEEEPKLYNLNVIKEEVIFEEEFDCDFKYQHREDSPQPFFCKICGSEFSQRKDATNHERTHTMMKSQSKKKRRKIDSDNHEPSKESSDSDSYTMVDETCVNCSQTESLTKNKRKDISKWTRTVRKEKRMKGEEYTGYRNIQHLARPMLPSPCRGRRKHKCTSTVEEHHRLAIYTEFRGLPSITAQRQFILDNVTRSYKKRTTRNIEDSRKTYTNHYSFTVNGEKQIVCREFFLATLNITDTLIRTSFKNLTDSGILISNRYGKVPPHNKLDVDSEDFLRNHINSFPSVESHYCKQSSIKRYLDRNLNISMMHRLYIEVCRAESRRQVSLEKYRSVFNEYNLGFHKTNKDRCKKCLFYYNNELL